MNTKRKRPPGRPPKPAEPGTMVSVGVVMSAELKARLDDAAHRHSRRQSQEAARRLEKSFEWQPIIELVTAIEDATGAHWRDDPETHDLAVLVINSYLEHLGPDGGPPGTKRTSKQDNADPVLRWSEAIAREYKSQNP